MEKKEEILVFLIWYESANKYIILALVKGDYIHCNNTDAVFMLKPTI